jgi:hypothetical protein
MDIGNSTFRAPFGARQVHTEEYYRPIHTPYMRLVPNVPNMAVRHIGREELRMCCLRAQLSSFSCRFIKLQGPLSVPHTWRSSVTHT